MNTIEPTTVRLPELTGTQGQLIGAALNVCTPGFSCSLAMELFHALLDAGLRSASIEAKRGCGIWCPTFIVWEAEVSERNPALRAVQAILDQAKVLQFCEVAFYDADEEFWRTVHPGNAPAFARFLSEESLKEAAACLRNEAMVLRGIEVAIKGEGPRE